MTPRNPAGENARARPEESTAKNAGDVTLLEDPQFEPQPTPQLGRKADVPCGAVVPFRPHAGAERYALCADGSTCGHSGSYVAEDARGREVAVCGVHRPDQDTYERAPDERSDRDPDAMPADPFDRSPEDYDVSGHPALAETDGGDDLDRGDGPRTDGSGPVSPDTDTDDASRLEGRGRGASAETAPGRTRQTADNESTYSDPRCIDCGDLLVVRTGRNRRCVECLLDRLSVDDRGGRR